MSEQFSREQFAEQMEERERKKQARRESRLRKIVDMHTEQLKELLGDDAGNFHIEYREIFTKKAAVTGDLIDIPYSESPAYGIILVPRNEPDRAFLLERWFRSDLDSRKENFDMLLKQSVSDRLKYGIKYITEDVG